MNIVHHSHRTDMSRCINGSIWPYVGAVKPYLVERRYAAKTIVTYLHCVTHFARWARSQRHPRCRINEEWIAEFLDKHLPQCACPGAVRQQRTDYSAALTHLLAVLRSRGTIAPPAVATTPVDKELRRYSEYMEHVRGLAPKTRSMALRIVGRLLLARFGADAVDIAAITPEQVRRFFAEQAKLYSKPVNAGVVVASLRSYFRYRASLGDLVHGLIGAVSYPANWSLASLPKTLTDAEVKRLIGSLGQSGHSMRRADAIVRCALDLGLRSGEIARSVWTMSTGAPVRSSCATPRDAVRTYCHCPRPPVKPLRVTSSRSAPRLPIAPSLYVTLHLATAPSAPISSARRSVKPTRAPGYLTRARICCATRWRTACLRAVPRSKK